MNPQGKYLATMNKAQRTTCKRLWLRRVADQVLEEYPEPYLQFRRRFKFVREGTGGYFFGSMPGGYWLGIEQDGYAHT